MIYTMPAEDLPHKGTWRTWPHSSPAKIYGFVDTLLHAHRPSVPAMLSAGGWDDTCPASMVERLFDRLNRTKQYTRFEQGVHTHPRESVTLFGAWLHLFA